MAYFNQWSPPHHLPSSSKESILWDLANKLIHQTWFIQVLSYFQKLKKTFKGKNDQHSTDSKND